MKPELEAQLLAVLRPMVIHDVSPLRIVDSLVRLIDVVAERNSAVGTQQIIATMARSTVPTGSCAIPFTEAEALTASRTDVVCLTVPSKEDRLHTQRVAYGPTIICEDFQMMGTQIASGGTGFICPTEGYTR